MIAQSTQSIPALTRLRIVDSLRGLALLGIIVANVPFPHDDPAVYAQRRFMLGSPVVDTWMQTAVALLIDKKFITLFSILFGFGFSVLLQKAETVQVAFRDYFARRMGWLLLIGCLHAYALWFGDIIRDYAICGLFLLLVYRWPLKRLLWLGILFAGPLTAVVFIINGLGLFPYTYDPAIISGLYTTDSYQRYVTINATIDPFVNFIQDSPLTLVACFGRILIGFWLGRIGFFAQPERYQRMMNYWIWLGMTAGLASSVGLWAIMTGRFEIDLSTAWLVFLITGGLVLQSLLYIALFVRWFQKSGGQQFLKRFEPVGQMALTNYLMQTILMLLVFYSWPHGLRLYGRVTVTETYLLALGIYGLQLLYSHWWMLRHKQGPVEWVWRKLTK